jgi:hypothetical protein
MKIQIEKLKTQIGRELNMCQNSLNALIEFNKLLDYVEELEQNNIESYLMAVKEFGLKLEYSHEKDGKKFLEVFSENDMKHGEWCKYKDGSFNYR